MVFEGSGKPACGKLTGNEQAKLAYWLALFVLCGYRIGP
jgi:hypothetical protein